MPGTTHPTLSVPEADLADLRARCAATRWPEPWPGGGWEVGATLPLVRRLATVWADEFDWYAQQAVVNALPWATATIDGTPVRYLRFAAERAGALPLVLTNGWPSTFFELVGLAERLSSPSRFGGNADDAFEVIVPCLPGFPFSPQRPDLPAALPTHEIWHRLMSEELGAARYVAHGGDLGSGVTTRLAAAHPEEVAAIHLLSTQPPIDVDPSSITPDEQAHLDRVARWQAEEGAYNHQQSTRPMTLAVGLSDSPAGLLAWIVEKYRAWSDCGGDVSTRFDDTFLLTQASLYWFAGAIGTSFRAYWETGKGPPQPVARVEVPTSVALFPADIAQPPRSWIERVYALHRYTVMPRGGHFAPIEEPDLLAADITASFRGVR